MFLYLTKPRIEHPEVCKIKEAPEKLRHKLSIILKTLVLILGIVTIAFGLNEATKDVLDPLGSNYWLSYSVVLSGIVVIVFV
jgi:TRAP-type C4-dicarboxylate transport system permease small subunit